MRDRGGRGASSRAAVVSPKGGARRDFEQRRTVSSSTGAMMPWVAHGVDSPRVNIGSWCELAALSQSRPMANLVTQHNASVAQLAEHALRKRMVMGSIPIRCCMGRALPWRLCRAPNQNTHSNDEPPELPASCGIRTHDLPLTERVFYQLS